MLPQFLQSTYKSYKEDTDIFANWLANRAQGHGYPIDNFNLDVSKRPATRLKGKAREQGKEAGNGKPSSSAASDGAGAGEMRCTS